jgi:hypothetical protein
MNHSITSLPRPWLAARAISRVARWQRRLSARMRAGDDFARQAGWTITRTKFGGGIYRDPRFDQLSAARAPGTSHHVAPPAVGSPAASSGALADTRHQRAASGPARQADPKRRNHARQHR